MVAAASGFAVWSAALGGEAVGGPRRSSSQFVPSSSPTCDSPPPSASLRRRAPRRRLRRPAARSADPASARQPPRRAIAGARVCLLRIGELRRAPPPPRSVSSIAPSARSSAIAAHAARWDAAAASRTPRSARRSRPRATPRRLTAEDALSPAVAAAAAPRSAHDAVALAPRTRARPRRRGARASRRTARNAPPQWVGGADDAAHRQRRGERTSRRRCSPTRRREPSSARPTCARASTCASSSVHHPARTWVATLPARHVHPDGEARRPRREASARAATTPRGGAVPRPGVKRDLRPRRPPTRSSSSRPPRGEYSVSASLHGEHPAARRTGGRARAGVRGRNRAKASSTPPAHARVGQGDRAASAYARARCARERADVWRRSDRGRRCGDTTHRRSKAGDDPRGGMFRTSAMCHVHVHERCVCGDVCVCVCVCGTWWSTRYTVHVLALARERGQHAVSGVAGRDVVRGPPLVRVTPHFSQRTLVLCITATGCTSRCAARPCRQHAHRAVAYLERHDVILFEGRLGSGRRAGRAGAPGRLPQRRRASRR